MARRVLCLIAFGMLAGPVRAGAACHWFGTQLDCAVGDGRVVIGTQAAGDPTHATSWLRPQPFHGGGGFLDGRASPTPWRIELQGVGTDPSLCRRIGNESYCY